MFASRRRYAAFGCWLASGVALSVLMGAPGAAYANVGVAAAVDTNAKGRPPGAAPRVVSLGQQVLFNEEITTDGSGLVQILLLDGTTFTVGPDSQIIIDEFVYDPNTGDAKVVASVTRGAFRFVGGQTSKQPGGATIKTPVGTIGIRGAIVTGNVAGSGRTTFSMPAGREVTFTAPNGTVTRIYRPGYAIDVGAGGATASVRPMTQQDAGAIGEALTGGGGGGIAPSAPRPTEQSVAQSPVTTVVSSLPQTPPVNPSAAPRSTDGTPAPSAKDVENNTIKVGTTTPTVQDEISSGGGVVTPPPPPPLTNPARILTSPGTYVTNEGQAYANAGGRGLVGSTVTSDRLVGFLKQGGRLVSSPASVDLPDLTGDIGDSGLVAVEVTDASSPTGPLSGIAYAGAGDFVAYMLGVAGNQADPVRIIYGTGTDAAGLAALDQGDGIRRYGLTPDPLRPGSVPFFATDIYGSVNNSTQTDFIVVEPGDSSNPSIKTFMSWIDISGEGADQKSAAFVMADNIYEDGAGEHRMDASRRGTFRANASGAAFNMRGGISTVAGPDGSHFFGPNAENFVVGTDVGAKDAYFDTTYSGLPFADGSGYTDDGVFGTTHVANLLSDTPQTEFARTPRTVQGYMAGRAESFSNRAGVNLTSIAPANLTLEISERNYIGATATLFDIDDQDDQVTALQLAFGVVGSSNGGSTFVDDGTFGATHNVNPELTRLITDGGQSVAQTSAQRPGSYFVSGRAVPVDGFQLCADSSCDFIDWGWWGTRVKIDANGTAELENGADIYVHLGTWVAGDVTDANQLPTSIVATYSGSVLGNVTRTSGTDTISYIAAGEFGMTFDFNARQGEFEVVNFDGMTFGATTSYTASGADGFLVGGIDDPALEGIIAGTFVNNGSDRAAGVIGDINVHGNGVSAVATFAGPRTGTAPLSTVDMRVLTAPDEFRPLDTDEVYTNVGRNGIVGSTPETDRDIAASRFSGRLVSAAAGFDLPDLAQTVDDGLEQTFVGGLVDGRGVSGFAYAGVGDFAAYLLGFEGQVTDPVRVIRGTATPNSVLAGLSSEGVVRSYTLTADPIRPSPLAFFRDDLYGAPENFDTSTLEVVDGRALLTWVDISGEGVNQKSAALVVAGGLPDSDAGMINLGRRGTFRAGATLGPANMRSGIGSVGNADGDAVFGADANYFVLSSLVDGQFAPDGLSDGGPNAGFSGNLADGYLGVGYPFATTHVANLAGKTSTADLSRDVRQSFGFSSGLVESTANGIQNPVAVAGTIGLAFDADTSRVSATAETFDLFDQDAVVESYLVTFGSTPTSFGASAYIDDDRFAASRNESPELTRIRTDGGQDLTHRADESPGSYLVSGKANPIQGYELCTQCAFIDWGWWGTRVRVDASGAEVPQTRTDFVHMGTWVAGDITNPNDLPDTGSATYAGSAIGNVARQTADGVAKYIAKGDLDIGFDFATRQGNLQVSNFDGMSFGGLISESSTPDQALFQGAVSGTGISGGVQGAFVNDAGNIAAGAIGSFGIAGPGVTAVGSFAGVRQ
jgi:hypothetical protein